MRGSFPAFAPPRETVPFPRPPTIVLVLVLDKRWPSPRRLPYNSWFAPAPNPHSHLDRRRSRSTIPTHFSPWSDFPRTRTTTRTRTILGLLPCSVVKWSTPNRTIQL